MKQIYRSYINYFSALSLETVPDLRTLVSADFHFVDPFNDVRDREMVIHIFQKMFQTVGDPKFCFVSSYEESGDLYVLWDFTFTSRLLAGGPHHTIRGMSRVREEGGQIVEHIDYWDSGKHIYGKIPGFRWLIKVLQKFLG
ncbi:MAG: nuclear transport factor 2 family protein [Bdellovibrionales bacterium]|nr:nuclear transport factor 2 family protein [Bdellovibrionales bacterium]